jgi:hypothetical protein
MNIKTFLIALFLFPSATWAQGVPAFAQRSDLFRFYQQFFIQNPERMGQEFDVFIDGTVLHGFIQMSGTSTNTHTDLVGLAQNIANTALTFFAIPSDYRFVLEQGGFAERKPVEMIGTWKNVRFALMIDDVPLENAYVSIMVDDQGRLRTLTIRIPRLRPEIVASVRGPTIDLFGAAVAIRLDTNQLPERNMFNIKPNTDLNYVNFRKVAIASEPYILYQTRVNRAEYTVNAKTGAIMVRASTITP